MRILQVSCVYILTFQFHLHLYNLITYNNISALDKNVTEVLIISKRNKICCILFQNCILFLLLSFVGNNKLPNLLKLLSHFELKRNLQSFVIQNYSFMKIKGRKSMTVE